ncbi:MAG: protein BatD [Elusimicrobiaceae bacterium]|nr:protein BatD [Elusimicrobiaceae bacterium]
MKRLALFLSCIVLSTSLWAQVRLTATTDKTDLALDDELTLTVQVSGANGNIVMPQLPSLPAFNVYSREVSQSTINGKTTSVFKYTMLPRFVGKATIGAITFNYQGKTYQTQPIEVRIYRTAPVTTKNASTTVTTTNRSANPDTDLSQLPPLERELATRAYAHQGQPYFVVAAVSNKKPYVNEPITLTVRFYYSKAFYDAPYQNPTLSNLFMEEAGDAQGQQTVNGIIYRYEEKRYRLTGVSQGEATIGSASVSFRPGSSPLSVLDRFFGGAAVEPEQTVSSAPIKLQIRPLPTQGKPDSFYGAVGTGYAFAAKLDPTQTEAGEAVTLSATVQGPGNLKTTTDLQFPPIEGLTAYPAAPVSNYLPNSTSRSYKIFKTVLVPAASGTYTIPALHWSYFDPQTGTYKTLTSTPLSLTVAPSSKAASQFDFGHPENASTGVQTIGQDIRYLISADPPAPSWLATLSNWGWLHGVVLAWLAICIFVASIGKKSAAKRQAYVQAKAHLKKATTYEHISDAISTYLLAKWKISTASLPLRSIVEALEKKGVKPQVRQQFSTLWEKLESARFAPAQADTQTRTQFSEQALALLKALEGTK